MEKVLSPLTKKNNVTLEKKIDTKSIIKEYEKTYNIDTSPYFKNIESVSIYRCNDSGYRFYHPFSINGDSKFYEQLEKFPWYYMDWKWEHEKSFELIEGETLLEVGCGNAKFLEKCDKAGFDCTGLELNQKAVEDACRRGINVLNETVQTHSENNNDKYDIVCSFQVLEHISHVKSFLQNSINCLKKSGKLIVCVPNNESFVGQSDRNMLNLPPHHMGLWDSNSLINLEKYYSVKLNNIYYEPLQDYHKMSFYHVLTQPFKQKYGLIGKALTRIAQPMLMTGIDNLSNAIKGHSILAVYEKVDE